MSTAINKLIMEAVSNAEFRTSFLHDPVKAAATQGADDETLEALKKIDIRRLRYQFEHLSRVATDLISPVADGHSRDWGGATSTTKTDTFTTRTAPAASPWRPSSTRPPAPSTRQHWRKRWRIH